MTPSRREIFAVETPNTEMRKYSRHGSVAKPAQAKGCRSIHNFQQRLFDPVEGLPRRLSLVYA